jgi:hypothetical protein
MLALNEPVRSPHRQAEGLGEGVGKKEEKNEAPIQPPQGPANTLSQSHTDTRLARTIETALEPSKSIVSYLG